MSEKISFQTIIGQLQWKIQTCKVNCEYVLESLDQMEQKKPIKVDGQEMEDFLIAQGIQKLYDIDSQLIEAAQQKIKKVGFPATISSYLTCQLLNIGNMSQQDKVLLLNNFIVIVHTASMMNDALQRFSQVSCNFVHPALYLLCCCLAETEQNDIVLFSENQINPEEPNILKVHRLLTADDANVLFNFIFSRNNAVIECSNPKIVLPDVKVDIKKVKDIVKKYNVNKKIWQEQEQQRIQQEKLKQQCTDISFSTASNDSSRIIGDPWKQDMKQLKKQLQDFQVDVLKASACAIHSTESIINAYQTKLTKAREKGKKIKDNDQKIKTAIANKKANIQLQGQQQPSSDEQKLVEFLKKLQFEKDAMRVLEDQSQFSADKKKELLAKYPPKAPTAEQREKVNKLFGNQFKLRRYMYITKPNDNIISRLLRNKLNFKSDDTNFRKTLIQNFITFSAKNKIATEQIPLEVFMYYIDHIDEINGEKVEEIKKARSNVRIQQNIDKDKVAKETIMKGIGM